jgi:hypothetical protein
MKSKYTTYLLIVLVAIIWGLIVKRMFFSQDDSSNTVQTTRTEPNTQKEEYVDSLFLNYPDPFLKKNFTKKQQSSQIKQQNISPTQTKAAIQKNNNISLQYVGYVREKKTGVVSYLVRINGVQQTMKQNENIDGLKLIKITADSLFFEKESDKYSLCISK